MSRAAKKSLIGGPPPDSLFFGDPIRPASPPTAKAMPLREPVITRPAPVIQAGAPVREPISQAWHEVAAECPDGRTAAEHCWPVDGKAWVHLVEAGDQRDQVIRCVPGERNTEVGGQCYVPVGGLAGGRTTHAHRLAEFGARV